MCQLDYAKKITLSKATWKWSEIFVFFVKVFGFWRWLFRGKGDLGSNFIYASFTICCSPNLLLLKMVSLVIQPNWFWFMAKNVKHNHLVLGEFYLGKYRQSWQRKFLDLWFNYFQGNGHRDLNFCMHVA